MVTRRTLQRITRTRQAGSRGVAAGETITQRIKRQETTRNFLNNVSTDIKNVISGSNNITSAINNSSKFVTSLNAPLNIKRQAQNILTREIRILKQNQTNNITSLKHSIIGFQRSEDKADDKNDRARELKYMARRKAAEKIIQRLKTGELLDRTSINKFIIQSGSVAERTYKSKKSFTTQKMKVQNFIAEQDMKGLKPSIIEIKKKFPEFTLKQAKAISLSIPIPKVKINTDKLIKDFGENLVQRLNINDVEKISRSKEPLSFFTDKRDIPLAGKQLGDFRNLNAEQQNFILTYSTIITVRNNLPSNIELNKLLKDNKALAHLNNINIKVSKYFNINKLIEQLKKAEITTLTNSDIKNINSLRGLSNQNAKNIASRRSNTDIKRIENIITSVNKYFSNTEKNQTKIIEDLLKESTRQANLYIKKTFGALPKISFKGSLIDKLLINSQIAYIKDVLAKGNKISVSEYKELKKDFYDWFGIKRLSTKISNNIKKDLKLNNKYKVFVNFENKFANFINATDEQIVKFMGETFTFIWVVLKVPLRATRDLLLDSIDVITKRYDLLNQTMKNTIYQRTRKNFNKAFNVSKYIVKGSFNGVKFAMKNPILVMTGAGILISKGQQGLRKIIKNNPEKAIAFVISAILESAIFSGAAKLGRFAKAKLSPFVVKNVDVFSDGASIRVSAEALKKLEGKRVNLFSTSKNKIKELFKTTPITDKELKVLVNDMLKNPSRYIDNNLKIRSLNKIAFGGTKADILNFMIAQKKGFLSGSGALKVQLKKFRKIGDIDFVVSKAKNYADDLARYLNKNGFLKKSLSRTRFRIKKKGTTYTLWDSGVLGTKHYNKKYDIADIVELKKWITDFGRKPTLKDFRKINGLNVLKVEVQLPIKTKLLGDPLFSRRYEKELKDLRLLVQKNIPKKKYGLIKKALDKQKGLLKVRGFSDSAGLSRKYGWAEKILGDLKLNFGFNRRKEKLIIAALKKKGLSDGKIREFIRTFSPSDMYFSPNVIYSNYFTRKGGGSIVYVKDIKISKYPKIIQKLIKQNLAGSLNKKAQSNLQNLMRTWRMKHPDKAFIGQKAIADRFGELEILIAENSKLYAKKYFITREVYIPALDKFVKIQQSTLGKKSIPQLKKLYISLAKKMKKGYTAKQMKRDILIWAKKNLDNFKIDFKQKAEQQLKFIKKQRKILNNEIIKINKSKLPITKKRILLKNIRRNLNDLTPRKLRKGILPMARNINRIRNIIRKAISRTTIRPRKLIRKIKRPRKITRIKPKIRKVVRPRKLIRGKPRVTIRPRTIIRPRIPIRPRKPIRPRPIIIPKKTIKKIPPKIRGRLSFKKKEPKGQKYLVIGYVKIGNKIVRVTNKPLPINKAWNRVFSKGSRNYRSVDNSVARSFQFRIVGLTKAKDDSRRIGEFKTRKRIGKDHRVLMVVEKSKYAIDSAGEKQGLKLSKALKQKVKRKNVKTKKKPIRKNKRRKRKSTNRKRRKK